jgi:hypothetical protein
MRYRIISTLMFGMVFVSWGCSPGGGTGSAVDAAMPEGDALSGDDVTGTIIDHYITSEGEALVPRDLSADFDMEVLVEDSMGNFTSYPGSGTEDGAFTFPDVPAGPFYLRIGTKYLQTDRRHLDLGMVLGERANAVLPSGPTFLDLRLDGLEPWQDADDLQLYAVGSDTYAYLPEANQPMVGETTLNTSVDFNSLSSYLIDGFQGDQVYLTQMTSRPVPDTMSSTYQTNVRVFVPEPFTMMDGETTTLMGSFMDVPQTESATIDWRGSAFEALRQDIRPTDVSEDEHAELMVLHTSPWPESTGALVSTADLVNIEIDDPGDLDLGVAYGNPFPASWELLSDTWVESSGTLNDVDGDPVSVTGFYWSRDLAADILHNPVQPAVGMVQTPLVDGRDALQRLTGVGTTPVLEWTAPAEGTADYYEVLLMGLSSVADNPLARIVTTNTAVRIPPDLLETGRAYFFYLRAVRDPDRDPFGLFMATYPVSIAERFTNAIMP